MTIQHMDNFGIYGTTVALMDDGIYAQATGLIALVDDPDGISDGTVVRLISSAASIGVLRYVLSSAQNKAGQAVRVFMNNLPVSDNDRPQVVRWMNNSNVELASVYVETTGRLTFSDGVNTITTANPVITANGWWHIEAAYDRSGVGSIEVRVEGVTVLQDTDLGYVAASQIFQTALRFFGNNFSSTQIFYKDLVIWDGSGAVNNDFLGSVLVLNLSPTSDVALNWNLVGGASGFSILDNIPPNDAAYIEAVNPPPAAYVCGLSDLPPDVTSVKGLMTVVRAQKSDGGDGSLQVSLISNGDVDLGADRPITTTMTYWRDVSELDPDTSAPWTPVAVDAAQMQIDRTT